MKYRTLTAGNLIKDGDQYSDYEGVWRQTSGAGYSVPVDGTRYRRPVADKPVQPEGRYWIQEQAPAGNFFDSVGLDPRTTLADAKRQAISWAKGNDRKVRLVVRTDVVILG